MPMYLLSVLSAPKLVLNEIRILQCNFLWAGRGSKEKFSLVNWEKVTMPKKFGGLGLRDPEVVREVQGAKIWWRWCNHKQEPWAKIWHLKYARGWPTSQLVHFSGDTIGSQIWQKAREGRRLI